MILVCSSKIRLLLNLNMEGLRQKFAESTEYNEGLKKLRKEGFTDKDETNPLAKILKTCMKEKLS